MTDIEERVRKQKSAKKKFEDAVKGFSIVLKAKPGICRLEEELNIVSTKYNAIRDLHDEITELMTEDKVKEEDFVSHEGFIDSVMTEYGALLEVLENYQKANTFVNTPLSTAKEN